MISFAIFVGYKVFLKIKNIYRCAKENAFLKRKSGGWFFEKVF